MTAFKRTSLADQRPAVEVAPDNGPFRQIWLLANVWLVFLAFPVLSVIVDDLSMTRKGITVGLLAVFAVIHMLAYTEMIRRELGLGPEINRSTMWFAVLTSIIVVAFVVGSWSVLAVLPFLVSFAIFHFTWRTALIVIALSLSAALILPALGGVLGQAWFFSVLVAGVGGAAGLNRLDNERQEDQAVLLTQLAVSHERDRLARDVHDVLGHSLTVVILKTQVCERLLQSLDPELDSPADKVLTQTKLQLAELEAVSRRALGEIRTTVGGLRTADLADELAAARVVLADAEVELTVVGDLDDIAPHWRPLVGWVLREAITNIVRHARATQCQVQLAPTPNATAEHPLIRISDDGVGIGDRQPGNGLVGLRERAEADGASVRVASGNGTIIEVIVPSEEARS